MIAPRKPRPGSAKVGASDLRTSDLSGRQADDVKPHSQRAEDQPTEAAPKASPEVAGALRDQVGRSPGAKRK
jgi:hypothetical protein